MKFQNVLSTLVLSSFVISVHAQSAEQVVLQTPDFVVTTTDFDYYVINNIPEVNRERTLAREGSVREVYENLYVTRALAVRGEQNPAISADEVDWLTNQYRERLLMQQQLELEVTEELKDMDWEAAAREEYTANQAAYAMPEQVSASHILISIEQRSDEEALAIAQEVLEKLRAGGDFVALAQEYSEDGSVVNNLGDLGFFGRGQMVAPFEEAVFAMTEPGQLSEPVKSQFGYHIIRFGEHRPASVRTFDQVKNIIIPQVQRRGQQAARAAKIAEVKTGAVDLGLEVNVDLLQEYEARYAPDEG